MTRTQKRMMQNNSEQAIVCLSGVAYCVHAPLRRPTTHAEFGQEGGGRARLRKPTNADGGSCKQGPNNICAANAHNGWIEPLLTLGKGDRGRDSRGWLSSQSATVQHRVTVGYGELSMTLLQHLGTPLVQLINAPTNQGRTGQRFDGQSGRTAE